MQCASKIVRISVVAAAVLVLGCGTESGQAADPTIAACANVASAWCTTMAKCAPYWTTTNWGNAATCATRRAAVCRARLGAADTGVTIADTHACAAALGTSVECEFYTAVDAVAACQPKPGTRKENAACGDNSQCSSGLCQGLESSACGSCRARAKVNTICTDTADCDFGLSCMATQSVKKCTARTQIGGTCDASHVCLAPAVCLAGKCSGPVGLGQACDSTLKNCDAGQGHYCHEHKGVCTAFAVAQDSENCGYFDGDRVACAYGLTCKLSGGGKGTCAKITPDGTGCSTGSAVACLAGAVCNAGVCGVIQPNVCQ